MPSNYSSLTVTWYDESDSYSTYADITADIKSLPVFTDTGTGEVNHARIMLRSLDGKYITNGNIIDNFDRFQIQCTDLGSNTYDRTFEVIDIIPSQNKGEGTVLTLDCLGIEYHTQHIHVSKPFYFESAFNVISELGTMYEENNGSRQPLISNHNTVWDGSVGNDLPKWSLNNYEYGIAEDSVYNRMSDVVEKLGASVSAGGALTFYELSFSTPTVNQIAVRARESGDNTPTVTVKNAKVTNPLTVGGQEGMIANPTGTNVLAWGSPEHGSLPVDYSKYFSGTEFFQYRPEWDNTVTYPQNAKVKVTNSTTKKAKHYNSDINNNTSTPPTNWTQFDMSDSTGEVNGDNVQYSPWTDDKLSIWQHCMANPDGTSHSGVRLAWDQNIVIWDDEYFRTWVDALATDNAAITALETDFAYGGTGGTLPRGFRVLVNGTGSGALANFDDMIVEWTGTEWRKKYEFKPTNDKVQIANLREGIVYEGDNFSLTPTWTALDGSKYGNDCFHPVNTITNVQGIDHVYGTPRSDITDSTNYPDTTKDGSKFGTNINSALKFSYTWSGFGTNTISALTADFYKRGAWACFRVPFPNFNVGGANVGDLYYPATLDIQNMHNTPNGNRGYNQDEQSENLGQINGVAFWIKLAVNIPIETEANDLFKIFMIDSSDNVVEAPFNIQFRDNWEDIRIPISSFRIYRGRKPAYGIDQAYTFIPPKDLGVVNQFEWRNIKLIGIQCQISYDEYGRYNPTHKILNDGSTIESAVSEITGGSMDIYIDGFRFTKPLLVTSGQDTTRNLEPDFLQRPNITNYWQLKNDAKSQLEIEKFKHKEFNIESSGDNIFDIDFGDSFLLENDEVVYVNSPNANETTNKIQLVAKNVEYSITKPQNAPGGLRRRIKGVKVFT